MIFTLMFTLTDTALKIPVDDELIIKIGNGDKQAFQTLYECEYESVYGFVLSIIKNKYDAEDVLHETFIAVHRKASDYVPKGKPMAWIFTIARNAAYDKLNEKKRIELFDESRSIGELDFSEITDIEDKMVINTLFKVLNDEEKQMVMLHAVGGVRHREIASVMNMPLNTELSKYHRAIKKLQAALKEENI